MVIRGTNSDLLASTTLDAMLVWRGELEAVFGRAQADRADCSFCRIVRRPRAALTIFSLGHR
jgi:hypothetical protein